MNRIRRAGALLALMALLGATGANAEAPMSDFNRDRAAILAMAGGYKISFKFDETVTVAKDAKPSEPYRSGADELVLVVEDTGKLIRLQHLLVVGGGHVVKHWRQDWTYEDNFMNVHRGGHTWAPAKLGVRERKGTWTQAVFNVDDSPRYEGVGKWIHRGDHSIWESEETWRALPRREYTKRDDYDAVVGRNRHSIYTDGWLHLQDNYKLAVRDGGEKVIAYETGTNDYKRVGVDGLKPAQEYWDKTKDFWAEVRKVWDAELAKRQTVSFKDNDDEEAVIEATDEVLEEYQSGKLALDGVAAALRAKLDEVVVFTPSAYVTP